MRAFCDALHGATAAAAETESMFDAMLQRNTTFTCRIDKTEKDHHYAEM